MKHLQIPRLTVIFCLISSFWLISSSASAIDEDTANFYAQNNILFYEGCKDGQSLEICSTSFPEETLKFLEENNVLAKTEENIERYRYAEEQTGIPWAAIAALHWREANMASDSSISNGEKLTSNGSCYTNSDGIKICGDPNEDAVAAAKHLIGNAKETYGIELTASSSFEDWANAFLAYNRGSMYKVAGATYDQSPYVMNGFDENHMHMQWIHADSWYGNKRYNSVEGKADGDLVGAMTVFAYLCGSNTSSSTTSVSTNSGPSCRSEQLTYYDQRDTRWGSEPFGDCGNIAKCGCGPSSFAMMATMLLGQEITPSETTEIACAAGDCTSSGSAHTITKNLSEHYGFEYQKVLVSNVTDAIEKINQLLKEGWMIHTSNNGHYIGIRGITDNEKWLIADSVSQNNSESEHLPEDIMLRYTRPINLNNIHAFRATNTTSCGDNPCDNGTGGLKDGGFSTVEEAEKAVMEPYRALDGQPSSVLTGQYGLHKASVAERNPYLENCVSFSVYFLNKYTSIRKNGNPANGFGDGGAVAETAYNQLHDQYPELSISHEPTVYSIASCGASNYVKGTYSHTFVVLGINQSAGTMIIGEAGFRSGWDFIGAKEKKLNNPKYASSECTFLDISAYLTGEL